MSDENTALGLIHQFCLTCPECQVWPHCSLPAKLRAIPADAVEQIAALKAKLDIIIREAQEEPTDGLAADYADPRRLDLSDEVQTLRKLRAHEAAKLENVVAENARLKQQLLDADAYNGHAEACEVANRLSANRAARVEVENVVLREAMAPVGGCGLAVSHDMPCPYVDSLRAVLAASSPRVTKIESVLEATKTQRKAADEFLRLDATAPRDEHAIGLAESSWRCAARATDVAVRVMKGAE